MHPINQAVSRAKTPADLTEVDAGMRRNPGEPNAEQSASSEYRKPTIEWKGLTISIENPAGSVRRGRNRHGVTWEQRMAFDYGEIRGTMGVDGDPVDVFLGPSLDDATMVYVVHQRKVGRWDEYDEDKCMVGFDSEESARFAFLACYSDPRFLGPITAMPVDEFVRKVRATKDKPAMVKGFGTMVLFFKAHVGPYMRGGKLVNLAGYQGRDARPDKAPGQIDLFTGREHGATPPLGPNPYMGKHPVKDTPDLFEDTVTEPRAELVAEHKHLVDVLRSPSHADDKAEAKKQAEELKEYEKPAAAPADEIVLDMREDMEKMRKAREWVREVSADYARNPLDPSQRIMMFGDDFALFELDNSVTEPGAVEVKWIQAGTKRKGIGTKAMRELQRLAARDGMTLTLYPSEVSSTPHRALVKFYRGLGFEKMARGSNDMVWRPGAPTAAAPVNDDHPSKPTRSLLNLVPEDRRDEWMNLHREQHELHHYEMGQLRELMDRARSARNRAEEPMRLMESTAASLRKDTLPGAAERAQAAEDAAAKHRAEFNKHREEIGRLSGLHQRLYERVADLGRQKNAIAHPTGDMDVDWAAMRKRTAEEQQKHEKSMLKQYRDYYKSKAKKPKASSAPVAPQPHPTETPEFKKWSMGLPVYENFHEAGSDRGVFRLYHATPADFDTFKPGGENPGDSGPAIWLSPTPKSPASSWRVGNESTGYHEGANVMPVYARLKNPMVIDSMDMLVWAREAFSAGGEFPQLISQKTVDEIRAEGYDSVVLNSGAIWGRKDDTEVLVFDPTQIKSATGNRGTFDPSSPDITKALVLLTRPKA